jgi:hypothetical protein
MAFPKQQIKRNPPFWTIWFPLSLGILVVLTLFGLILFSSSTGNTQISMWAQISTVLLVILAMLIGLFLLFFLLFGVIGFQKLANRMPGWLSKANSFSVVNLARIRRVSIFTGKLVIVSETLLSQLKSAIKLFVSIFTHKKD